MSASIHIPDDLQAVCCAGAGGSPEDATRCPDGTSCAVAGPERSGDGERGSDGCPSDEAVSAPDPEKRERPKRIFLLLALSIVAGVLVEGAVAASPGSPEDDAAWEEHLGGVGRRTVAVEVAGPAPLGARVPGPPAGTLGHRGGPRTTRTLSGVTTRSLCSLDIDLTAPPPALRLETRVCGVALPEIHVPLRGLARAVLGRLTR